MVRTRTPTLAMVLFAAFAGGGPAHARDVTLEYVELAVRTANADVRRIEARLAAAKTAPDVVAICRGLDDDVALDIVGREHLLAQCALTLAHRPVAPQAEAWLDALSGRPVHVWVRHRHGGRATRIPGVDPGAAARFATRTLAERARANVARSKYQTLSHLRSALKADPTLAPLVVARAQAEGNAAGLIDALDFGNDAVIADVLNAAKTWPDRAVGLGVLHAAAARPACTDRALFALADIVRGDPGHTPDLMRYLDQPDTAWAAAAAVASLKRGDLATVLIERLDQPATRDVIGARILALHLMDDARARDALLAWSQRDGPWPGLRAKVRRTYFGGDR